MKSFEYVAPKSLKEATGMLAETWGDTEILAGGTDLVTGLKQGITEPKRVVSLRNLPELRGIKSEQGGVRLGSMTTLAELSESSILKREFPSLVTAAKGVSSPQIMSVGTVGGDLCQRPRCWYFRNGYGLFAKQGENSLARTGENRYHAIFATDGPALFVSPSGLAPAFIALGATITVSGPNGRSRKIAAADFFQIPKSQDERETVLRPNEILTEIFIPSAGLRNATYEIRHRHGLDWPYVTTSVAFKVKDGVASDAKVVLGHVAPTPWMARDASNTLNGARIDDNLASKSAEAATKGANPLSQNAYKVPMLKAAVRRAVLAAAAG